MSSGPQQLLDDYEQIQKLLELYPNIKLIETEGDPPERYDIEYTIKGYKTDIDGSTAPTNSHQVRITLPFGYPHFPPTAKPLSSIFHPDIDPDAIRIADFWQDNKSLADLILHIGEMICGIHVTKGEPFNQKAADWYEDRKGWLPFDTMEPSDHEDDEEVVGIEVTDSPAQKEPEPVPKVQAEPRSRSGKPLDILKEDFDFPFDDDELLGGKITGKTDGTPVSPEDTEEESLLDKDLPEEPEDQGDDILADLDQKVEQAMMDSLVEEPEEPQDDILADFDFEAGQDLTDSLTEEPEKQQDDILTDLDQELEQAMSDSLAEEPEEPQDDILTDLDQELEQAMSDSLVEEPEEQQDDILVDLDLEVEQDLTDSLAEESEDIVSFEIEDSSAEGETDKETDDLSALETDDEPIEFSLEEDDDEVSIDFNLEVEDETELKEGPEEPAPKVTEDIEAEEEFTGLDDDSLAGLDLSEEVVTGQEDAGEEEFTGLDDSLAGLDLADEEPPDIPAEKASASGARSIEPLIEKKEIFTAKKVLADVHDADAVPNRQELEKKISEAITEAEELYKKADALEQRGELEKAGLMLDLVANIATDYPGLEFARNRIRESMMAGGGKKEEEVVAEGEGKAAPKKKSRKISIKIPYKIITALLIVIGLIGGGVSVYLRDSENIDKAKISFQQAEELLGKKEFKDVDKSLKSAQAALDNILILNKDAKEILQKKIDAINASQLFKEGLQGRVLYNGEYVTVEKAKNIDTFVSLKSGAETQLNSNNTDKAIELYEQAVTIAEKIGFGEEAQTITQTIYNLRLNQTLDQARKAEEANEWKQAADTYAKALELSKNLSTEDHKNDIATRLASASFRHEIDLSKRAFTASEWQKTIEMLQRALSILEANPEIASESEKTELNILLVNSKLYHMLSGAKKAYERKEWELAVKEYNNAIDLLESNVKILGEEAESSVKKIKKTILMTQISREQELSTKSLQDNDLKTTRQHYLTIASLIEDSLFKDEEMLEKILDNARTQSVSLEKEIVINKRIDWLLENFEDIFRKSYPSAKHSELLKPQVTFIKKEDHKLIFNMSCVENKQGRTFRLELNYQYDQEKDTWNIYSGKL